MIQTKVSITDEQDMFVNKYKSLGFKNKSSMFRKALDLLMKEFRHNQLKKSADLYAELYSNDEELKKLTDSAISDWPE